MTQNTPITIARGDGIGPEIMSAALKIMFAAGARIDIEEIEIGEKVYRAGHKTGMTPGALESLRKTRVFLKSPITTPQGGGYKSLNVTTRKAFGLYANVRPCVSYHPFVATKHPKLDVVIVRENEEDLYAGIEYRQTVDVVQALKLITRPGCERIVRYAFEYARQYGRKKVSCFIKDNIMKQADGLFHQVFNEIGAEYPDLEKDHWIVDIGAARLADTLEMFDVIVMPNLYGDILSDVAAQIAGSVGLAGSANIGIGCAMFEAIHGSAPTLAGQNIANPSGLILASVMMLAHIGQHDVAEKIHNAWLSTIEDGVHTADYNSSVSTLPPVGTDTFADEVIKRLGKMPNTLKPIRYDESFGPKISDYQRPECVKATIGVDVFIDWKDVLPEDLAMKIGPLTNGTGLKLAMIGNRGIKVWPDGFPETFCSDQWRCRFLSENAGNEVVSHAQIVTLLDRLASERIDFIQTENLCVFDGVVSFSAELG